MENNVRVPRRRRRLQLKFLENQNSRWVTFHRRREGIYKKASELCILAGVDIAILVTSLGGNTYSFVHPCLDSIASRLLDQTTLAKGILEPYRDLHIIELAKQLDDVSDEMKKEMQRLSCLNEMRNRRDKMAWEKPLKDLTSDEASVMKEQLLKLHDLIFYKFAQQWRRARASHAIN